MTKIIYPLQVLAYSLGLGTLVQDETKLRLHMKAELDHNDSPYGLLVMTGMEQMCTLLMIYSTLLHWHHCDLQYTVTLVPL